MKRTDLKNRLEEVIKLGKEALEKEVQDSASYTSIGVLTFPTVSGPSFDRFTSEAKTILDRHLKQHELYKSIHDNLYSKNYGYPSTVKKVVVDFEAISKDEEFLASLDEQEAIKRGGAAENNKVFIVHGHDIGSRDEVEKLMWRIGMTPVIMMNEPNKGLTLIEKLEQNTDVGFSVVLYTACDVGRDANSEKTERLFRTSGALSTFETVQA